jgi:UDP-3-O-[3-hydroxymyristoyl] glucosamine N-acyltransferase
MSEGFPVSEIARRVGGRVEGDGALVLGALRPLDEAGPGDLTFLGHVRYRARAAASKASALLTTERLAPATGPARILVKDTYAALAELVPLFHPQRAADRAGIAPEAVVSPGATLGEGVSVGPLAVIGAGVTVGARTVICPGVVVGEGSRIGEDCLLHPGVRLYPGMLVGNRVILHAGVVIGSDGFGYATVEGRHRKIAQVGTVRIEDDVEIGANSCVDRASLGETVIGRGTKVDNLVQIAHNVKIGADCFVVSQAGIAGSSRMGDNSILAGQSGVVGHVEIGNRVVVAGKSVVTEDIADGSFVAGYPAVDHRLWKRAAALFPRLPKLRSDLRALEERLARLESGAKGKDKP